MGVANRAGGVDHKHAATWQVHETEHAVGAVHGFVSVGEQRKLKPVLGREFLVAGYILGADAQHLRRHP